VQNGDRSVTPENKGQILDGLREIKGQKVVVSFSMGDPEASRYARQIGAALRAYPYITPTFLQQTIAAAKWRRAR
jgi:hypothetical protein